MTIRLKRGVFLTGRSTVLFDMILAARTAYAKMGKDVVITSGAEGTHRPDSLHYKGRAIDLRTRHLTDAERVEIMDDMKAALGSDFQTLFEGDHFHLEYDPPGG